MELIDLILALRGMGIQVTRAEVENALASVDLSALTDEIRSRFIGEVWDGTTPINGVPADEVRRQYGMKEEHRAYIIRDATSRAVIYFQPHAHDGGGPLTAESVSGAMARHLEVIVQRRADEEVLRKVAKALPMD